MNPTQTGSLCNTAYRGRLKMKPVVWKNGKQSFFHPAVNAVLIIFTMAMIVVHFGLETKCAFDNMDYTYICSIAMSNKLNVC